MFVLSGDTAMALHLGHRMSVDFDFFGDQPLDPARLMPAIPFLAGAIVPQREPNTLSCIVGRGGPVNLSFFGLPGFARLSPPLVAPDNGLRIASLLHLAGMKASVVQMRAEAQDYLGHRRHPQGWPRRSADGACRARHLQDRFQPVLMATLDKDSNRGVIAFLKPIR